MNVRNDNRDLLVLLRYNYGVLPALPIGRGGVPRGGEGPFICQSVCLCGQCVVIDSSTGAKIVCTHASPSPLRVIPSRGVLSAVESRDYCAKTPQNFGPDQTAARPTPGPDQPPRPSPPLPACGRVAPPAPRRRAPQARPAAVPEASPERTAEAPGAPQAPRAPQLTSGQRPAGRARASASSRGPRRRHKRLGGVAPGRALVLPFRTSATLAPPARKRARSRAPPRPSRH